MARYIMDMIYVHTSNVCTVLLHMIMRVEHSRSETIIRPIKNTELVSRI